MDAGASIVFPSASALLRRSSDDSSSEKADGCAARARKVAKTTKSEPKPLKAKVAPSNDDAATKPKQSKSRNGCTTCKQKRLKCDESKPGCKQCERRRVECGGYKKDFKWRPFEETTFTNKIPAKPRMKKSDENAPIISQMNKETATHLPRELGPSTSPEVPIHSSPNVKGELVVALAATQTSDFMSGDAADDKDSSPKSLFSSVLNKSPIDLFDLSPAVTGEMFWDLDQFDNVCDALSMPQTSHFLDDGLLKGDLDLDGFWYGDDSISPVESLQDASQETAKGLDQLLGDGSDNTDVLEALLDQPSLGPTSPEILLKSFDRFTCGILSVRDGPTENPWRNAVLPLVHESETLYHAVVALAAFHSSRLHPQLKVVGMKHMEISVRSLVADLPQMRPDIALASTLVLAFAEAWDVHVSTGIKHLIGAKACIAKALPLMQRLGPDDPFSRRIKFLCNTWVYMDVMARLTSVEVDESTDFDAINQLPGFSLEEDMEVDPLMGCSASLFPLIGRVANLVHKVRKAEHNSISIISQASELKAAIEAWSPPQMLHKPEDELCDVQDAIKTAEAYRWATLLFLHQAIPEMPSLSAAELARNALVAIALVPSTSRNTIVHIYPLLAAGCEANTAEDREWIVKRWEGMSQRMQVGNVDRCLEVTKEVWDRRDQHEADAVQFGSSLPESCVSSKPSSPLREHARSFSPDDIFGSTWNLTGMGQSLVAGDEFSELLAPRKMASTTNSWSKGLSIGSSAPSFGDRHRFDNSGSRFSHVSANSRPRGKRSMSTDMASTSVGTSVRSILKHGAENVMFERTVRGSQHWIGVMHDWDWEG